MNESDADYHDRVVREVLGDVEMWTASRDGPNGPWNYRSLTVRRRRNRIIVFDVDGNRADTISVFELPNGDEAHEALKARLESLNEELLAEL